MTSTQARLALLGLLATLGCARGNSLEDDASVVVDAPTEDVAADDIGTKDVQLPDVSAPDVPSIDVPRLDVPPIDVARIDVPPVDVARIDVPPVDVPPVDVPPIGPVVCTPATASAVCGARPCVDGFCCDTACDGACRSCALAGSEGRCSNHPIATDPESECAAQAPATCGTTGVCNGVGACARHPMGTPCDDGAACTSTDTCDGAGVCRGAAPAACAPGAGNQCCLGSCDPMAGCRTTAGLCADQCNANVLRTARACQGCGAAGAVGTCGGGGEFTCDAATHSLCQTVMCGGQSFHCTNDGGVWQWRTATRCDDGDACTHTDACAAGSCRGTALTCNSDQCMTRACVGAAACMQTPRTGMTCDDGNALTINDACTSAGACTGTAICGLPTNACANGAESRDRCTGARVIGRRVAASTAGFSLASDTCRAFNRFDDCSWDAGGDHSYRIWARAGETITVTLTKGDGCTTVSWDATLKIYQGADCGTVTCSRDLWCRDRVGSGAQTYVAPRDGWIVIVVDGSTAFDDEGDYTLRVRLTGCREATCECP